jgi:magnesium chelatase subunit I
MQRPRTVGELRSRGHRPVSVKDEMRANLIRKLRQGEAILPSMVGYQDTVVPEVCNAILARHDLLLLGLRGQGKTRLLRGLVDLLDEAVPAVAGCDLRDDPLAPISAHARNRLAEEGDDTPIVWVGRHERYQEKLATPDVTMADLFGDIDLVKHAQGRSLADEGTLHYGLIPRSNRGIFCINELPDLAPKIQVGLFNLLQERDVQIRGYPVRFPLDMCLAFSANPEDYTTRGRIVTPLKDRIGSVVRTHYPRTREAGLAIIESTAWLERGPLPVFVPVYLKEIVEETARRARVSPAVDQHSGVSARLSIAGCELLVSNAERRALVLGEQAVVPRLCDLTSLRAGSRGKLEAALGEEEGNEDALVEQLVGEALAVLFPLYLSVGDLGEVLGWFGTGRSLTLSDQWPASEVVERGSAVPTLADRAGSLAGRFVPPGASAAVEHGVLAGAIELILEGLYRIGKLSKQREENGERFGRG